MRQGSLEELSEESERLLGAERVIPPASDALRIRAMARAREASRGTQNLPVAHFWQRRMPQLVAASIGLVAFGAYAAWQRYRPDADPDGRGAATAPRAVEPPISTPPTPAPPSKEEVPPSAETQATPPAANGGGALAQRTAAEEDGYAVELQLLQRARAAVGSGDYRAALSAIAEHQQRFPRGRLREEREALRVSALAGVGRKDEARRAAERFRAAFPRSVLSSRIEQAIR